MILPKIRSHLLLVPLDDAVTIGSTPTTSIEIEDEDHSIYRILCLSDGTRKIADITREMKRDFPEITIEYVSSIIEQISEVPYIMEEGTGEKENSDVIRESRNLNFLSNFDKDGSKAHIYLDRIVNSNIMVIGMGGAGTNFVLNMASWGVRKIVGVDFDSVQQSNLNRQILFSEEDIGKKKVFAAQSSLKKINSCVNFIPLDKKIAQSSTIVQMINQFDINFVFCAADTPTIKIREWINEACQLTSVPWAFTAMSEYVTQFQMIVPHETACWECFERSTLDNKQLAEKFQALLTDKYNAENDCILANSSLASAYLTFDVIKLLAKLPDTPIMSKGNLVKINHFTNEITSIPMKRHIACQYCEFDL